LTLVAPAGSRPSGSAQSEVDSATFSIRPSCCSPPRVVGESRRAAAAAADQCSSSPRANEQKRNRAQAAQAPLRWITRASCWRSSSHRIASDDRTDEIVRSFGAFWGPTVRVADSAGARRPLRLTPSEKSTGEVIVFTDSATRLEPDRVCKGSRGIFRIRRWAPSRVRIVSSRRGNGRDRRRAKAPTFDTKCGFATPRERPGGAGWTKRLAVCSAPSPSRNAGRFMYPATSALRYALRALGYARSPIRISMGYYSDLHDTSKEYERKVRTVVRGNGGRCEYARVAEPLFGMGGIRSSCGGHKILRWDDSGVPHRAVVGLRAACGARHVLPCGVSRLQSFVLRRCGTCLADSATAAYSARCVLPATWCRCMSPRLGRRGLRYARGRSGSSSGGPSVSVRLLEPSR